MEFSETIQSHQKNNNSSTPLSPNQKLSQDYRKFVDESIQLILQRNDGTDKITTWSHVKKSRGVDLHRGIVKDSSWNCLKAVVRIEVNAQNIADILSDPSQMPKFDEMVVICHIIEDLNPEKKTTIRHVVTKPFFPTAPRDFLVLTSEDILEDGTIIISTRSIQHPKVPELNGFVRANTIISGYIIRPIGKNNSEVTLICHMDLGGYLPATIINFLGVSAPVKLLLNLKSLCEVDETSSESA